MSYVDKDYVKQEIDNGITNLVNLIKSKFARKADLDEKISIDNLVEGENIEIKKNEDGTVEISATGDISVDYNFASNKPKINGVELKGNKTSVELGIENKIEGVKIDDASMPIKNKVVEINLDYKANATDIPVKVSELENDSKYINEIETENINFDTWE